MFERNFLFLQILFTYKLLNDALLEKIKLYTFICTTSDDETGELYPHGNGSFFASKPSCVIDKKIKN